MRLPYEIVNDLRTVLSGTFRTVRVSAGRSPEQIAAELGSVLPDDLPGVILVFEQCAYLFENTVFEIRFSLQLADSFAAYSDDRIFSALRNLDSLLSLFPPGGRTLAGVFYSPGACTKIVLDGQYATFSLALSARQAGS